jgi:hypothetical protein
MSQLINVIIPLVVWRFEQLFLGLEVEDLIWTVCRLGAQIDD